MKIASISLQRLRPATARYGQVINPTSSAWNGGKFAAQLFHQRNGGIGGVVHGKQDLELTVPLREEASQVGFQALVHAGERFEDADRYTMP
jgi:hypothetical protein